MYTALEITANEGINNKGCPLAEDCRKYSTDQAKCNIGEKYQECPLYQSSKGIKDDSPSGGMFYPE